MAIRRPRFDECYQARPEPIIPSQFQSFWNNVILSLKKVPLEPQLKLKLKRTIARESLNDIQFRSQNDTILTGFLNTPRKLKRIPVVITFHDYLSDFNRINESFTEPLSAAGIGHLYIKMRGHENLASNFNQTGKTKEPSSAPTLFLDQQGVPFERSYGVSLVLDALRAIDFLRLNKNINHSAIGILGRGLGCVPAMFAAAFKPESVKGLSLERPGPVWHEEWLQLSQSQLAVEWNEWTKGRSVQKKELRERLKYLDPIYVTSEIQCPVLMSTCLEDSHQPGLPGFG
ncbi:MAG: acetylxylan esterase, partial [Leptonema sp. (in: Bacteria)]|nr:acetylxylan esterase [Leptonema sp. (in: bacteria)]